MSTAPGTLRSLPGPVRNFFDYRDLYDRAVNDAPPGSWLVEIGVYHGASLTYLAHAAKEADKNLTVVGIDHGRGSAEHADELAQMQYKNLAGAMLQTVMTAGVADDCAIILAPSVKAAKLIPDGSCHMVFIDAGHDCKDVIADIKAYLPKVAKSGWICGHDYFTFNGVRVAVHEVFGHSDHMSRTSTSCWEVRL